MLALAWWMVAISALLARAGVARPDLDVFQLVVRWRRREKELSPISLGAAVFQFLLGIVTLPAVKLLPPSVLYQPELGPSRDALLLALGFAAVLAALVYWVWYRPAWHSTRRRSSNTKPRSARGARVGAPVDATPARRFGPRSVDGSARCDGRTAVPLFNDRRLGYIRES